MRTRGQFLGLREIGTQRPLAEHHLGLLTAVGLQARSAPPLRYLRDLVAEAFAGRVPSTSMLGAGGGWGATYDNSHAYLLDVRSGATLLSIPFGHSVDALAMVLGEFRELSAHIANLRPEVTHVTSGAVAAKSAEDQVAVTAFPTSRTPSGGTACWSKSGTRHGPAERSRSDSRARESDPCMVRLRKRLEQKSTVKSCEVVYEV